MPITPLIVDACNRGRMPLMTRTLNKKFFFCLLGATLVVAGVVHGVHALQARRSARGLLLQAERAEKKGNFKLAAGYLNRYLFYIPDDTDALARYGLALDTLGPKARQRALLTLEQVLRRDPERTEVRRKLVQIAVDLQRYSDAKVHLNVLLPAESTDGELYQLLGECEEVEGRAAEAAKAYAQATRHPPQRLESYSRLAALLWRQFHQPKQADEIMERLVQEKQTFHAYLARSRYLRQRSATASLDQEKLLGLAGLDLEAARKLAPQESEVQLESAEWALTQGRPDAARAEAQRGLVSHPKEARLYLFLSGLEHRQPDLEKSIAILRQGLESLPGHLELLWTLADRLIEKGEVEEAGDIMAKLRQEAPVFAPLDYLESCVLARHGEWLPAARLLERTHPQLIRWPRLRLQAELLLGLCYEQMGDIDLQYAAFRRALSAEPLSVTATYGAARGLVAMGKLEDAAEVYRRLAPRMPGFKVHVARLLLQQNLNAPQNQRQWSEFDRLLQELERVLPKSTELLLLRAESLAARDQPEQTQDLLLKALADEPHQLEVRVALVGMALYQNKLDRAAAILDDAEKQLGDRVELRRARARYWAQRGGVDALPALARLMDGMDRFDKSGQRYLLQGLTEAYSWLGDLAQAEHLLARLAEHHKHNLSIKLSLFDLALDAGNDATMDRLTNDMQRIEGPEGASWRYARAIRLLWMAEKHGGKEALEEIRSLLTAVAARRPAWHRVSVCLAKLEELRGKRDAAVNQYLRAIELGERSPVVIRHTLQLLYESRRFADAIVVMQKLPERLVLFGELQQAAVDLSLRAREYSRALTLAQKAIVERPQDYRNHVWLGRVLMTMNRHEEAEPALRRAIELAGDDPVPRVVLIQHLIATGQKQAAETEVQKALKQLPGDQAPLALAPCYEMLGQPDRAKEMYQAALAARPTDLAALMDMADFCLRTGQLQDGETYLRRVISLKSKGPNEAAAARSLLGLILTRGGRNYQQSRAALAELGILNDGESGPAAESVEDQLARARTLAALDRRPDRLAAIRTYEKCKATQPLPVDDEFLLARLHQSVGDWAQARRLLFGLVSRPEPNPVHLVYFARALLRHDEHDAAHGWLAQLEKRQPDALTTHEIKARVLAAQGDAPAAVRVLAKYAQNHEDKAHAIAVVLEQVGQPAAARAMYERSLARSNTPPAQLAYAQFLGRQGEVKAALDACEKAAKTTAAGAVAAASLAILYQAKGTKQDYDRVARWLDAAARKEPTKAIFLNYQAALHNLQGNIKEAETIYRDVLALNQGDPTALNNLAWLLAFQPGKGNEALQLIERALTIMGPEHGLVDTRAVIHLAAGRADQAVKELEGVLAEKPTAEGYFHLARAHAQAKNRLAAVNAFRQASRLGLNEGLIHPLEREAYQQLCVELDLKKE